MERLTNRINGVATYVGAESKYNTGLIAAETALSASAVRKILLRLAAYEDTGLTPESTEALKLSAMGKALTEIKEFNGVPLARLRELAEADKDGRCVMLPCRKGERWASREDGRTVIVTGVSVYADGQKQHFEIYFDYENAASRDDPDSDCAAYWEWFARHYARVDGAAE